MSPVSEEQPSRAARGAAELALDHATVKLLRARLAEVAEHTVGAVVEEVPGYATAMAGPMGANIQGAVQLALGGFLSLAGQPEGTDPGSPLAPALEGAYTLGRGEARSGRSMDALLAAYRVGARVAWRELSGSAVGAGVDAQTLAKFAELVFAYIDELSAASVAGHTDELANTGRVRRRHLDRLGRALLAGAPPEQLEAAADRADWAPPETLTAVLLPSALVRGALGLLDPRTLWPEEDLPALADLAEADLGVLLVPDAGGSARPALLRGLRGRQAYVGPARPWSRVRESWDRVLATYRTGLDPGSGVVDTEQHLATLVLSADPAALADLRAQALAPLEGVRPGTAERLAETLREWLLHHGRRDEVAAVLHVHPQTVRYRMGQLRELYGDRLTDPMETLALTVALAGYQPEA